MPTNIELTTEDKINKLNLIYDESLDNLTEKKSKQYELVIKGGATLKIIQSKFDTIQQRHLNDIRRIKKVRNNLLTNLGEPK